MEVISLDQFRINDQGVYRFIPQLEGVVAKRAFSALREALRASQERRLIVMVGLPGSGKTTWIEQEGRPGVVYFDSTATDPARRALLIEAAKEQGASVEAVWIRTPVGICASRNADRPDNRRVPSETVQKMSDAMNANPPSVAEGFEKVCVYTATNPMDPGSWKLVEHHDATEHGRLESSPHQQDS